MQAIQFQAQSVEQMTETAISAVYRLFESGKAVSVSFSGGKDSSVLMHVSMMAALRAQASGLDPYLVVLSSDTGVENPEVAWLLRQEHQKIENCLKKAGIKHKVVLTRPSLATSWPVRILGGNKLPSFPGQGHDCSVDFKVNPISKARKALFNTHGMSAVVTVIGTRFDESAQRARAMTERGELAHAPYVNEAGEHVMSPLAFWTTDDVWELIGLVRAGAIESYSDFDDTFRLYADAGGTSCAVVSDAITEGAKKARKGCGARFGCYTCVVANDNSLEAMIDGDPRYAYMRGLNNFRNLIAKSRWDFSKRFWVQRTISAAGNIKLQPDCFSPAFVLELFRYAATLDAIEARAASALKIKRRFQILGVAEVVAIDALWSLNGFHPPHTALLEWLAISEGRASYAMPDAASMVEIQKATVPAAIEVVVGPTWDGERYEVLGGRYATSTALADCVDVRNMKDGRLLPDMGAEDHMTVDFESFMMALDFELPEIERRHREAIGDFTAGYRFWTNYGTLGLSAMQQSEHDKILRRTAWKAKHGFIGEEGNSRAKAIVASAKEGLDTEWTFSDEVLQIAPKAVAVNRIDSSQLNINPVRVPSVQEELNF
ncbi:phosphoadenosine phosphosulfate reductase family protein [Comamonas thiooxydans]|uniref:phosphoadenosine phosphosulfate reductase domain-containing protein n=1 Tax=Comamonas thiooxydans TaxID=363952 RepID=UPI000B41134F|nr:phosphoadenosine phosphosulfate reductase family protein [Comamonas thiooxydans]